MAKRIEAMTLEEAKVELEKFVKLKTTMRPAFVQPLLDAVEVVRCKDCKYWDAFPTASSTPFMHECGCRYPRRGTSADDFCSWGERREDGTKN